MNRSRTEEVTVTVALHGFGRLTITETATLTDDDPNAVNTAEEPDRVTPAPNDSASIEDGALTITLPPVSWTAVALATEG